MQSDGGRLMARVNPRYSLLDVWHQAGAQRQNVGFGERGTVTILMRSHKRTDEEAGNAWAVP